jgi:hypothetical protein
MVVVVSMGLDCDDVCCDEENVTEMDVIYVLPALHVVSITRPRVHVCFLALL